MINYQKKQISLQKINSLKRIQTGVRLIVPNAIEISARMILMMNLMMNINNLKNKNMFNEKIINMEKLNKLIDSVIKVFDSLEDDLQNEIINSCQSRRDKSKLLLGDVSNSFCRHHEKINDWCNIKKTQNPCCIDCDYKEI